MIEFPDADDYVRAVQDPRSFVIDELRDSSFPVHPLLGVPMPASGSSAVVFKAVVGGEEQALRFFTRSEVSTRDRYRALNEHFESQGIASHMATSTWLDDAIKVNGQTWPAVRMQWVNGRTLDQYIDGLVDEGDAAALAGLVLAWRGMVRSLQSAGFAHGDLQHGNVMVDDSGLLRLVDFDCSWLDAFDSNSAPSESGHRNYQRTDTTWGRWMDTFPGLVVHTSLLALVKKPSLWVEMHNGENLIFESDDFVPPHEGRVWREIDALQDQQLTLAASRLRECCGPSWTADGGLESLLGQQWWDQTKGVAEVRVQLAPPMIPTLTRPKQKTMQDKAGVPPLTPRSAPDKALTADRAWLLAQSGGSSEPREANAQQNVTWPGSAGMPSGPSFATPSPGLRRTWTRKEKTALMLAVIMLIGVIALIVQVLDSNHSSSGGSSASRLPTSPYDVYENFSLKSLPEEVGSCEGELSELRMTSYDVNAVGCTGSDTPYSFVFHKYSGVSSESWVELVSSKHPLSMHSTGSCYDTYSAVENGKNYVLYVYKGNDKPFVGVVYPHSSVSVASVVSRNFVSISRGC